MAAEAELARGRGGEVVLAAADVGPAVDHAARAGRGRGGGTSPSCRTAATCWRRRASRSSACRRSPACCRTGPGRTTRRARGGRRSAARAMRVSPLLRRTRARALSAPRTRLRRTKRPARVGAVTVDGHPAATPLDLQSSRSPGAATRPLTVTRLPAWMFNRFALTPTCGVSSGRDDGRRGRSREAQRAGAAARSAAWIATSILLYCHVRPGLPAGRVGDPRAPPPSRALGLLGIPHPRALRALAARLDRTSVRAVAAARMRIKANPTIRRGLTQRRRIRRAGAPARAGCGSWPCPSGTCARRAIWSAVRPPQ